VAPAPNAAGWSSSDVKVTLAAVDEDGGSGVAGITYSADGAQVIAPTTVPAGTASVTIDTEGVTTLTFFSTDNAGNEETAQALTIRLDKTAPTVTCRAYPSTIWPPNGRRVRVTVKVGSFAVAETSWKPAVPETASVNVVRAERNGKHGDRVYTLTYQGADVAGNEATRAARVTVLHDKRKGRDRRDRSETGRAGPRRPPRRSAIVYRDRRGGVPERSNGTVLKTVVGSRPRGFESLPRRLFSPRSGMVERKSAGRRHPLSSGLVR
jgi:hypothetical protein